MKADLRERARETLRLEIARAATEIFATEGFDATSVEEVSQRVGISRATFFRYFACKEDAVLATLQPFGVDYAAELARLDIAGATSTWAVLRRTVQPVVEAVAADPDRVRRRVRMLMSVESLQSRLAASRHARQDRLAEELARQLGDRLTAAVLAAAVLGALDVAWREWATGGDEPTDFGVIVDEVFARLPQR
ncbi:TetR/AcrR family transcriptional regulator [Polymorphospora rubra]|uniref:TetR family transcriptional regulator n=1 Tax=Polymorphospora rubra TaxID=338584 RepID=A0A810N3X7_9ACTN|nr:TetR family transcriptional regulator [Polymorphospora rubra]BCJ67274.1 TetR family transcriptional regulator [Polymorphospora rubra]